MGRRGAGGAAALSMSGQVRSGADVYRYTGAWTQITFLISEITPSPLFQQLLTKILFKSGFLIVADLLLFAVCFEKRTKRTEQMETHKQENTPRV